MIILVYMFMFEILNYILKEYNNSIILIMKIFNFMLL